MKIVYVLVLFLVICSTDLFSISNSNNQIISSDTIKQSVVDGMLAPALLIGAGLWTNQADLKMDLQDQFHDWFGTAQSPLEDYLQHVPFVTILIHDMTGKVSIGQVKNHILFAAMSETLTIGITHLLKTVTKEKRPNGGDRSFPSGHTAYAFTAATVQYHLYKGESPWWSLSGYIPAIATGVLRILRDKHWVPDVLVGAGLGILVPNLMKEWSWVRRHDQDHHNMTYHFGIFPGGIYTSITF